MGDPHHEIMLMLRERNAARSECARLREKLERQQASHLEDVREREAAAAKVYDDLLAERNALIEELERFKRHRDTCDGCTCRYAEAVKVLCEAAGLSAPHEGPQEFDREVVERAKVIASNLDHWEKEARSCREELAQVLASLGGKLGELTEKLYQAEQRAQCRCDSRCDLCRERDAELQARP